MNLKPLFAFMAAFFILEAACLFIILRQNNRGVPDVTVLNDITQSLGEQWGNLRSPSLPGKEYPVDYTVLDSDGNVLAKTSPRADADMTEAIERRDAVINVESNGRIVGRVIFTNASSDDLARQRQALLTAGALLLIFPLLFCAGFALYLRRKLIRPFRKLDGFARRVAAGNLEIPLEMDRHNLFGPFTESFDLMRTELARARRNEYLADQSKKELVASLSHDIKTPVSSIQAVTELMLVREEDPAVRRNLTTIADKSKQITALVTDLFHASLAELQKLKVTPAEGSSAVVTELLRAADYAGKSDIPDAPPCMLQIDRLRLQQVFDNIFSNSYKYAGTEMKAAFGFESDSLMATVSDHGPGAPEGSLPLLCNKFYRGGNAQGKSGSGLGLYLARYFMEQMGGGLSCGNIAQDGKVCGFAVRVFLPLAGRDME